MKTREQILSLIKNGELKSETLDGRDFNRLIEFFPVEDWETFGFKLNEGAEAPPIKEFSENYYVMASNRVLTEYIGYAHKFHYKKDAQLESASWFGHLINGKKFSVSVVPND
jgi:hypothetical protein